MVKTLGLDLGTNSIGWALVNRRREDYSLVAKGCYIFQEGVAFKKGSEKSKSAERREKRQARRRFMRRRRRKQNLLGILVRNNMCPLSLERLKEWRDGKDYPREETFHAWLKTDPYKARAAAVEREGLDPLTIGRALYHIGQRRGFRSNRLETTEEREGVVSTNISELSGEMGEKTLGQYFSEEIQRGRRVRNRYTSREKHYLHEFRAIVKKQGSSKWFTDQLKNQIETAIFFQRPLKSQKGLVGKCTLEPDKPRCPVSHPMFEKFRALQLINSIKCKSPDSKEFRFLSKEERESLIPIFYRKKANFKFSDIAKKITPKGKRYSFNYREDRSVSGCPVGAHLKAILGDDWEGTSIPYAREKDGATSSIDIDDIWHVLFSFPDEDKIVEFGMNRLGLAEEEAKKLLAVPIRQGYGSLSIKAIKKILPYLERGLIYTDAVFLAGIEKAVPRKIWESRKEEIQEKVLRIIEEDREDRQLVGICNHVLKELQDKHGHISRSLDSVDEEEAIILDCLTEEYGRNSWNKRLPEEQKAKKSQIRQKLNEHLRHGFAPCMIYQRLDEKIQNYLRTEVNLSPSNTRMLYHPSDIGTYPASKKGVGGAISWEAPSLEHLRTPWPCEPCTSCADYLMAC